MFTMGRKMLFFMNLVDDEIGYLKKKIKMKIEIRKISVLLLTFFSDKYLINLDNTM